MEGKVLKYPQGRFDLCKPEGGIILDDAENRVTQVIKDILWKLGKNLISGQFGDCMKIATPAYVHSHKSYLHMISKDLSFYEYYVAQAMTRPDDPIWKIKNVSLAITSALHLAVE